MSCNKNIELCYLQDTDFPDLALALTSATATLSNYEFEIYRQGRLMKMLTETDGIIEVGGQKFLSGNALEFLPNGTYNAFFYVDVDGDRTLIYTATITIAKSGCCANSVNSFEVVIENKTIAVEISQVVNQLTLDFDDLTPEQKAELTGPAGVDGINGIDGINGVDGVDGIDGTNGANGVDGYTPIKNVDYFDGKDFEFEDFTPSEIELLQQPAIDAAALANTATTNANNAATNANDKAILAQTAADNADAATLLYQGLVQVEVSTSTTALESWKNKVILVTNDATITIPATLSENWACRVVVLNGFLNLAITAPKTWYYGMPTPFLEKKSDFIIRQRGVSNSIIVSGNFVSNPFVATFDTRNVLAGGSTDNQVKIPFANFGLPVIINWGDGNIQTITDFSTALHTFSMKKIYEIKIYGTSFKIPFSNGVERLKILEIKSFGNLFLTDFYGCENLFADFVIDIPNLTSVSILANLFRDCYALKTIKNLNYWNLENITNISYLFANCTLFNQDLNGWNVSNVTNFRAVFNKASIFNGNIAFWNTSSALYMSSMFNEASNFNRNIGNWNVSNVTNMGFMFAGALSFNFSLGNWDISKVSVFTYFMNLKTNLNYSSANLDAIYIGWSSRLVISGLVVWFGSIKRTSASTSARNILTSSPNNWTITDGGI